MQQKINLINNPWCYNNISPRRLNSIRQPTLWGDYTRVRHIILNNTIKILVIASINRSLQPRQKPIIISKNREVLTSWKVRCNIWFSSSPSRRRRSPSISRKYISPISWSCLRCIRRWWSKTWGNSITSLTELRSSWTWWSLTKKYSSNTVAFREGVGQRAPLPVILLRVH
jgi:hypothetical protein